MAARSELTIRLPSLSMMNDREGAKRQRRRSASTVATRVQSADLEAAFKELRPPPPLPVPAAPVLPSARTLQLGDVLHSDTGALIASWLPSVGDAHRLRCASKALATALCDGPFRFVGLFRTHAGQTPQSILHPHQLASLRHMSAAEAPPGWRFGELRGGILADDPGLGKTVTMLALIVQSIGVMPAVPLEFWDPDSIREGWEALRRNRIAKQQLLPLLNHWRGRGTFGSDAEARALDEISRFCNEEEPRGVFPSLASFEDAVRRGVGDDHALGEVARRELNKMRRGLDRKNRKFFATTTGKRALLERELRPVAATLVVVPTPLLEHWAEQLRRHVDLGAISISGGRDAHKDGRHAVYVDGLGDLCDVSVPFPAVHLPTSGMAPVEELTKYAIVLTTFERCHREQLKADVRTAAAWQGRSTDTQWAVGDRRRSPLMSLRWLRLVVDEGHALGGGDTELVDDLANDFIATIAAERRWVLSGTLSPPPPPNRLAYPPIPHPQTASPHPPHPPPPHTYRWVLSGTPTIGADVRASLTQARTVPRS